MNGDAYVLACAGLALGLATVAIGVVLDNSPRIAAWWATMPRRVAHARQEATLAYSLAFAVPGHEPSGTVQNPSDPSPAPRRQRRPLVRQMAAADADLAALAGLAMSAYGPAVDRMAQQLGMDPLPGRDAMVRRFARLERSGL